MAGYSSILLSQKWKEILKTPLLQVKFGNVESEIHRWKDIVHGLTAFQKQGLGLHLGPLTWSQILFSHYQHFWTLYFSTQKIARVTRLHKVSIHQLGPLEAAKPYSEVSSCYCVFHHKLIEESEHLLIDACDEPALPKALQVCYLS